MFELPEAKRVRRDEILSPLSSVPSSPELRADDDGHAHAHALLGKLLDFETFDTFTVEDRQIDTTEQTAQNSVQDAADEEQEQEFEFRLFSRSVPAKRTAEDGQKPLDSTTTYKDDGTRKLRIRLCSPTPGPASLEEGKFVNPFRGWQYYFTTPALWRSGGGQQAESDSTAAAAAKRKEYEDVAVSGRDLLELAGKGTWPGCHLPWRVIHLKSSHVKLPAGSAPAQNIASSPTKPRKKKPGKKRRIILRKRAAAAEAAKQAEAEKRNKKNREKKIKRRQRERERKAALAAAAAAAANTNNTANTTANSTSGEGTGAPSSESGSG
ncbi:hypothetical protein VTN77DRAFT_6452 [Rasamsonia byssochlamydoides]|uniref:uncharacterized protein n=1 Tax=Rasamsonia byssochlamydoides TaxID=89139 RepID=UPI003742F240